MAALEALQPDSPLAPKASPLSAPAPTAPAAANTNAPVGDGKVESVTVQGKAPNPLEEMHAHLDDTEGKLDAINKETGALQPPQMGKEPPPPEKKMSNPLEGWGGAAMVFAAIGSLMTRQPLATAMNAAAGAIQAVKKGDDEAYNQAYEQWKVASDNVIKQQNFQVQAYNAALKKIDTDQKGALAEFSAYAKAFGDEATFQRVQQEGRDGAIRAAAAQESATTSFYKNYGAVVEAKNLQAAMKAPEFQAKLKAAKPEERPQMMVDLMHDVAPDLAQSSGTMSSDAILLAAQRGLAGDTSATQGMGYGKAGAANRTMVSNMMAKLAKEQGMSGSDIAARVAEFQGLKSGERTLATTAARIGLGSAELQQLEPGVREASAELKRTNYPNLNALIQAGQKASGDPKLKNLAVRLQGLKSAFSQVLSRGGTPTDATRAATDDLFNSSDPDNVMQASLAAVNAETAAIGEAPGMVRKEMRAGLGGQAVAPPPPPPGTKVQKATSQEEFNKLPSKSYYTEPNDNTVYYKP